MTENNNTIIGAIQNTFSEGVMRIAFQADDHFSLEVFECRKVDDNGRLQFLGLRMGIGHRCLCNNCRGQLHAMQGIKVEPTVGL